MCCLYFSTSFMWSFRHSVLPWKREDVSLLTSSPQMSHFTFSIPQLMQTLPTPITSGKLPGVPSSLPQTAHLAGVFELRCCMSGIRHHHLIRFRYPARTRRCPDKQEHASTVASFGCPNYPAYENSSCLTWYGRFAHE